MAYVNKQNLSDFWTNAKRYIAARDADQCNWTSVPVNASVYRFEAEPRTPVNPVVEFGFTETPPAEGEKSPTNPSTITGVDSVTVTRTGKNLIPMMSSGTATSNGITFTVDSNGTVTANGTASGASTFVVYQRLFLFAGQYCISGCPAGGSTGTYSLAAHRWGGSANPDTGSGKAFTVSEDGEYQIYVAFASGFTASNLVFRPQIELGSGATAYEPPSPVTATVTLGETRYGGTLDVATGKMTVTWGAKIIDGTENFGKDTTYSTDTVNVFTSQLGLPQSVMSNNPLATTRFCSHFFWSSSIGANTYSTWGTATNTVFKVSASEYPDVASFKSWLASEYSAGHPVVLGYLLNTPYVVDLDPQQLFSALSNSKVNTVFTDTGTISQLTYAKPAPSQEDVFRYANWHRTETAGAVICAPVPDSVLHPTVNFSFTEVPPESGDKSPSNPSTITGVDKINLYKANKNMLAVSDFRATATIKNATWTNNGDGSISVTRDSAGDGTSFYDMKGLYNALEYFPAGTYTFTRGGEASNVRFALSTADTNIVTILGSDVTKTFTLEEGTYLHFYAYLYQNDAASNVVIRPQLEFSPEASNFEIGISDTYQVSFGSTYYGGSIDLSTGLMTVTRKAEIFDSSTQFVATGFTESTTTYRIRRYPVDFLRWNSAWGTTDYTSDKLGISYGYPSDKTAICLVSGSACVDLNFLKTDLDLGDGSEYNTVVTAAHEWLDDNPITFVYLSNTQTVQLTPQQIKALPALDRHEPRINTLYTDADSIQVSYQKSPIQTEREITDAILALGSGLGI